jgi:hypothetical protein
MTEADFIIIATAIAVVGAIIVGVIEPRDAQALGQSRRERRQRPGASGRAAKSSEELASRQSAIRHHIGWRQPTGRCRLHA